MIQIAFDLLLRFHIHIVALQYHLAAFKFLNLNDYDHVLKSYRKLEIIWSKTESAPHWLSLILSNYKQCYIVFNRRSTDLHSLIEHWDLTYMLFPFRKWEFYLASVLGHSPLYLLYLWSSINLRWSGDWSPLWMTTRGWSGRPLWLHDLSGQCFEQKKSTSYPQINASLTKNLNTLLRCFVHLQVSPVKPLKENKKLRFIIC